MNSNPAIAPSVNPVKDIWRLVVSYVTTAVIGVVAHLGFHVALRSTVVLAAVVGVVLAAVLRWLEKTFPWVGALLGLIGAPAFPASSRLQAQAYTQSLEAQVAQLRAQVSEALTPSAPTSAPSAPVAPTPTTPA